jgi:RimJ/RimL family protein N-acetyltransferase
MTSKVQLRDVAKDDLPILFEQQQDVDAIRMAAFPPRDHAAFMEHWSKLLGDPALSLKTILFDGQVAGYISSWEQDNQQLVAYWIGKNFWGKGIATGALADFLKLVSLRPLYAHVAIHNIASIRVLEKCGFTISSDETKSSSASDGVEEVVMKLVALY